MSQKKILVVDDDAVILKTLCTKLTSKGYQAVPVSDGSEAVTAVRRSKPDLIVLDVNLPVNVGMDWNAFSIIEWLKHVPEAKGIPIIIISGGDPAKIVDKASAAGAVGFFQKPINHEEMDKVIRKTLNLGPALPEIAALKV
ncbi:MAG TPA: response regulator [Verrucomicrobiae bacterium]|jgi:two-component system chemotaxis response regulator CheY|nr:response regulator [Verrucomicrobiae bacterium]